MTMADDGELMQTVEDFMAELTTADHGAAALPPVHDAGDAGTKPTAPCMVCGQIRWRVWCHDERKVWQWICNGCRPLVVINADGTTWRS